MDDKFEFLNNIVYISTFSSLDLFLNYICNTDVNPIFKTRLSSVNGSYDFTGTNSFEEAWNLCRFTMNEGFQKFDALFNKLKYEVDYIYKKVSCNSVVGYAPNVPRYILGLPKNMCSYQNEKSQRVINVYMNLAYSCNTSHNQIINRGVLVLRLIDYLEKNNYKVNFCTFDLSKEGDEWLYIGVTLKSVYENLNIKKMYFPLVHPSFLRRLSFRAVELSSVNNPDWSYGYGHPIESYETIQFLEQYLGDFEKNKIIYISSPTEMKIEGYSIEDDFNSFIDIINNKYGLFDKEIHGFQKKR